MSRAAVEVCRPKGGRLSMAAGSSALCLMLWLLSDASLGAVSGRAGGGEPRTSRIDHHLSHDFRESSGVWVIDFA